MIGVVFLFATIWMVNDFALIFIKGIIPLYVAVREDAYATAEVLIQHGADVQDRDNEGRTPLHYAVVVNAYMTTKVLIQHGADINAKDNDGMTPLYYAG